MADEAEHLSPSLAPSLGRVGDTRYAVDPSSSAGTSYELHDLPEKARHIATPETRLDDEQRVFRASRLNKQQTEEMSRAPLLVRSSPAQGTGKLIAHCSPVRSYHLMVLCPQAFQGFKAAFPHGLKNIADGN
jgi:hypothetical protein